MQALKGALCAMQGALKINYSGILASLIGRLPLALLLLVSLPSHAIEPYQNYDRKLKTAERVAPLGDDLFGEEVSLYNGSTTFTQVDFALPGNSALSVELRRTFSVSPQGSIFENIGAMANWDIAVPHIHGEFGPAGWVAGDGTNLRCSKATAPPGSGYFNTDEVWSGNRLEIPGEGGKIMMVAPSVKLPVPTTAGSWPWITQGNYRIGCLASTANGYAGEGFLVLAPNGQRYFMNWMVERGATSMTKPLPGTGVQTSTARKNYYLMATRVEDRYGNWVNYQYTGDKLTRIESNDGRWINFAYSGALVSSVASSAGTYAYQYQSAIYRSGGTSTSYLSSVTRPDGSTWTFGISGWLYQRHIPSLSPVPDFSEPADQMDCPAPGEPDGTFGLVIKHPSGATGTFSFGYQRHYRTRVPKQCSAWATGPTTGYYQLKIPNFFDVYSLQSKQITGPGLPGMTWSYNYGQVWTLGFCRANGFCMDFPPCPTCAPAGQKFVSVTNPDGSQRRYSFGVQYGINEGRLFKTEVLAGSAVLSATENVYHTPIAADLFPVSMAAQLSSASFDPLADKVVPVRSTVVTQDGVTFSRLVAAGCQGTGTYCFDALARPTVTTRVSSLGYTRTETNEYHDNTYHWVLGQTARVRCTAPTASQPAGCGPTGTTISETAYDSLARPTSQMSFGRLKQTLTYNPDGTVATVKDGNNNTITLTNWYRGVPRAISYPDSTAQSATVNDSGWITSATDQNGYVTGYGYDAMGRLASVVYPTGDTTAWNTTTQVFQQIAGAEYGIPAGHWRQTISTGNARKITYFDALWRPLVTKELDATNTTTETLTKRFQRFTYDHEGRTTFASYPGTTDALNTGTWTEYDALGRGRSVSQDSEQGLLTTTTNYLNNSDGPYTLVTTPAGQQTRTWFQMFDQPDYSRPVTIWHPEVARTHITRDVFGKPTRIRRSNSNTATGGTLAINRDYTYNAYQELCRSVEPETGATLMGYDEAGNLTWSASGLPTSTACHNTGNTTAINARKAVRTYDARNRITALSFPDGLGDTVHTYTPDGLPAAITAYNAGNTVTTEYTYNRRRLLTQERMLWNSIDWPITYTYNANGHRLSEVLPGNVTVNYAPNALGQPTQAGSYATGVTYYPNGAIKQFTYGNGVVHNLIQNARQLPERSYDCAVAGTGCTSTNKRLDLTYAYDTVGNVSGITDNRNGRQTRSMSYDGLDRLTQTISPMFGTASYSYNALDNLTAVGVTGGSSARTHTYTYNAANQVSNIKDGSGATVVALEYDVQGNVDVRSGLGVTHDFTFDFGNRLRSVAGKASYVYDGQGRRVRDYTTASKYSLYSQDGRLMYASDSRQAKATQYVYLGGSLVAFRETPSGGTAAVKYQHTDALGTPIAVTDAAKAIIETSEYEPYGQLVNSTLKDGPGFTGHVQDAATGLTYMQQRYYDPTVGRFLSVDPVTALSSPVGMFNRYRYANSNPYRFVDPDGRKASMLDHPGIPASSVQGIEREPGSEAAPMPVAEKKSISATQGSSGEVDKKEQTAVDTINNGLDKARGRVDDSKNPALINAWNKSSWQWDPNNPEFVKDPNLAAFVNPASPFSVFVGFRLAAFSDSSMKFTYHNASFLGGSSAMVFVVLHEFGHVWTAGQGTPGPAREQMANSFAFGMLRLSDRRSITCKDCK